MVVTVRPTGSPEPDCISLSYFYGEYMKITWVSDTRINWTDYMATCIKESGQSPTRGIDASHVRFNEALTYALTLNEMTGKSDEPMSTIRRGDLFLEAISVSMLVKNINISWHATITKVDLLNHLYLLQGNLAQWKYTIRGNLTSRKDTEQARRILFDLLLLEFEKHEYGLIWDSYSKEMLPDGTFILREK